VGVLVEAFFRVADADGGEGFCGAREGGFAGEAFVDLERFDELGADLEGWVEGRHGVLEDHADAAAADAAEIGWGQGEEVLTVEEGGASVDASWGHGDEAEHGVAGDGLAGAGFADDADGGTFFDVEGDAGDGADDAVPCVERDTEVTDFEERHAESLAGAGQASHGTGAGIVPPE